MINEAQKPLKLNKQGRNRHNQTWEDIFGPKLRPFSELAAEGRRILARHQIVEVYKLLVGEPRTKS